MKRLIDIEGLDGSGKETQAKLLKDNLERMGEKVKIISFPNYNSESGKIIKEYLAGKYGDITPYQASMLYAVDRMLAFKTLYKECLEDPDCVVIADRYVHSNIIYQASKIANSTERQRLLEEIYTLEFVRFNDEIPDLIIYLDVEPKVSRKLLLDRYDGDPSKLDIHESNLHYLEKWRKTAIEILRPEEQCCWIDCCNEDNIKSKEQIAEEIFAEVLNSIIF